MSVIPVFSYTVTPKGIQFKYISTIPKKCFMAVSNMPNANIYQIYQNLNGLKGDTTAFLNTLVTL